MIETRLTNEGISRDVDTINSTLVTSDRNNKELFKKLKGKFNAQKNDIDRATDTIVAAFRQYTYYIKREKEGIRNHISMLAELKTCKFYTFN